MTVKTQYPIKIDNQCGCIVDEGELTEAILWYTDGPVQSIKKIYISARYPTVSIRDEKVHVHRLLFSYWAGRRLLTIENVHHKDENRLNASKDNLSLILGGVHQSLHNKGKLLTDSHKAKIGKANHKRRGIAIKKSAYAPIGEIRTMLNQGISINRIAKSLGVDWSTVKNRIIQNPELLAQT